MKRAQRRTAVAKSSRLCWYPLAREVTVDVGRQVTAHVSGIARCGSPWACPMCAPVVRERRAAEIDQGIASALGEGLGVEFLTVTVRHHAGDGLAERLEVIATALRLILTGAPWARRRAALGYIGAIRAVEVTYGTNGWHPHLHALLLFDRPLSTAERADLREWIFGRWSSVIEARGLGSVTRRHGVDLQPVTTASEMGGYLTKVVGGWGAGLELARADLKTARAGGTTPVGLLRHAAETGDARSARLWQEYERATLGKRAIVWSPGLRARLLGDELEASDVEVAASEGADETVFRALVAAARWRALVDAGDGVGSFLTELECVAAALLYVCDTLGVPISPIDGRCRKNEAL